MANPTFNVRMPPEMLAWLEARSEHLDRTPAWVVRKAISEMIERTSGLGAGHESGRKPRRLPATSQDGKN